MFSYLKSIAPMRIILLISVVVLILSAPFAGEKTVMHGWEMLTSVIFPVFVPMYFFILPLDMTMCLIMMQDKPADIKSNYKKTIWLEAILMVLLLFAWFPFVYRLLNA